MSIVHSSESILDHARSVLDIEMNGIREVRNRLGQPFVDAILLLAQTTGKVVVSGMGKSGRIGQKISATFSSTGTPSIYLHPSEAAHGDLGMISPNDILLTIAKSGESDEMTSILPIVHKMGVKIISLLGNINSTMARHSDIAVDIGVSEEACDLKLAPTTSTTAALTVGDAIAVVLMNIKGFKSEDFARFHPAGQLGKRLLLSVNDMMRKGDEKPVIQVDDSASNLIYLISKYGLGVIGVCDAEDHLLGIITDGDLRRALEEFGPAFFDTPLDRMMTRNPQLIQPETSAYDALLLMEKGRTISHLPVIENETYVGMLCLHDLIKQGL